MRTENVLFNLPLYRVDENRFIAECKERRDRSTQPVHEWRFNEVIGWLVLWKDGRHLKGDLWWRTQERFNFAPFRHPFAHRWVSRTVEIVASNTDTNGEILADPQEQLADARRRAVEGPIFGHEHTRPDRTRARLDGGVRLRPLIRQRDAVNSAPRSS